MKLTAIAFRLALLVSATMLAIGCTTTTNQGSVGVARKQLMLIPNSQIVNASLQGYQQVIAQAKAKGALDRNPEQTQRVQRVLRRLVPATETFRRDAGSWQWEVHVIENQQLNAFCMPGGKIIFYSGIIERLNLSDAEIAAIMGHEIAHALREHGRERMSQELIKQAGFDLLVNTGTLEQKYIEAASLVTNVAFTLRHSRQQESEADDVGIELMARGGYDPNASISLWQKMGQTTKHGGPEFLSTHPSSHSRIQDLRALIPRVMPLYKSRRRT